MIKTRFLTVLVIGGVLLSPHSALAIGRKIISCEAAQQGMTVSVMNGIGVDIRLSCAGNIADAQVSDPSRVVVRKRGPQQLYIKPIGTINLPGNLHSSDGMTMLSVVTTTGDIYQFAIKTTSSATYSFLDIGGASGAHIPYATAYHPRPLPPRIARTPQPERSLPVATEHPYPLVKVLPVVQPPAQLPVTQVPTDPQFPAAVSKTTLLQRTPILPAKKLDFSAVVVNSEPQKPFSVSVLPSQRIASVSDDSLAPSKPTAIVAKSNSTPLTQANAIVRGLAQLRREKKVVYRDSFWLKVQDVVFLLRKGKSVEHASKQAGVPISKIKYLLTLGGNKSLAASES